MTGTYIEMRLSDLIENPDNPRETLSDWGGKSPGERAKMQLVRVRHFTPKGCGTEAAHTRHVRAGEEPCEQCKAARSEALARRRGA